MNGESPALGGWLLLLSRLLVVGHPLLFASIAPGWIAALPIRGTPLAIVLVARLLVAAAGLAAGIALTRRHPGAVRLAAAALAAAGLLDLFTLTTSYVPNNRAPGDTPFYIAASLAYHGGWMVYLARSRRVRRTFPADTR